jgi:ribosomal protein S27AE
VAIANSKIVEGYMLEAKKMLCPNCGAEMNHHADKLDFTTALTEPNAVDSTFGGIIEEIHTCPKCKNIEVCRAS